MRTVFGCVVALFLFSTAAIAQFKAQGESRTNVTESIIRQDDSSNLLFGWFDPSRLTMRHSFSVSYQTVAGQGISLGTYTNSLMYKFSDPLNVQFDVTAMHSPFNSLGKQFQNDLSGIFISRAELNYKPSENVLFQIQYRQLPAAYWLLDGYRSSNFFGGIDRYEEGRR